MEDSIRDKFKANILGVIEEVKEKQINILLINIPREDFSYNDDIISVDILIEARQPSCLHSWMPSNDRGYWTDASRKIGMPYNIAKEVEYKSLFSVIQIGGE